MNETKRSLEQNKSMLKEIIMSQYEFVFDYQGNSRPFVEEFKSEKISYLRVIPPHQKDGEQIGRNPYVIRDELKDPTGAIIQPQDITEGVIVESLLGEANALDDYAINSQKAVLNKRILKNKKLETALKIINKLLDSGMIQEAVTAYSKLLSSFKEGLESFVDVFGPQKKVEISK